MKKVILTLAAIFAFGFANAQDKKENTGEGFAQGDVFATGSFGFGSTKTGDVKSNTIEVAPAFGYFVSQNIAIGARLSVVTGKDEAPLVEDKKINNFSGEVFGRYYFTPTAKFSTFAELGGKFGSNKTEQGIIETKSKTFGVNAGIGFNYFLASNWSIEAAWAGLGYNTDDNGGNGAEKTKSFGLDADLSSINIGLTYKF